MAGTYKWYGSSWWAGFHKDRKKRMSTACIFLENQIKRLIGEKYPPASTPGEPPHLRTNRLRSSITHTVSADGLTGRVGTNVKYGRYLEGGTTKMDARPFILKALENSESQLQNILTGGK